MKMTFIQPSFDSEAEPYMLAGYLGDKYFAAEIFE